MELKELVPYAWAEMVANALTQLWKTISSYIETS